jgi:hypothetical protein
MASFLLLLSALAVGGLGCIFRRRSAFWSQGLILLGCVGCAGVLFWQVRQSLFRPEERAPNRAHAVVSFYFANQVLREIAGRRGVVVLIFPPLSVLDQDTAESYARAFSPLLLRGHPELEVQVATLEAPAKAGKSGDLPLAAFKQLVARFPNALAFVCYSGVPVDIEQLFPTEQKNPPAFCVYDPAGTTHWASALKKGRLQLVIVPRPGVDLATQAGIAGAPGDIFNQLYLSATPETADQVAAQLGKK